MRDRVLIVLSALVVLVACTAVPKDRRADNMTWYDCLTDNNREHRAWMKRCS